MMIIINNEESELSFIKEVICEKLGVGKTTAYQYISKLTDLKMIKQKKLYGKRVLTVPKEIKGKLHEYILPIFPSLYQFLFSEIMKSGRTDINTNIDTEMLEEYRNEVQDQIKKFTEKELPTQLIPNDFFKRLNRKLEMHLKNKIRYKLLY